MIDVPPPRSPGDVPVLDYLVNVGVALIGAFVRFLGEWRANFATWDARRIFLEGFFNALTSGFVGLLTFWVLISWKVDLFYTAFAVGLMGHMGPEGINLLRELVTNVFRSRSSAPPPSR